MLTHAMHLWTEVITQVIWPHAVSLAVDVRNKSKLDVNGVSPIENISIVKHSFDVKDNHIFGCPEHVLQASL